MNMRKIKHILRSFFSTLKTKNVIPVQHIVDKEKILNGHVALITGGSGGIGMAIAKSLLESGCNVIIAGTNEVKLNNCLDILKGRGVVPLCIDLHRISDFESIINEAEKRFGPIDILVNSAGVHSTKPMTDFFNTNEEEYDYIMSINLKGTYFMSQAVAKQMIKNKVRGHILNISSSTANEPAWSAYRLSKNGIEALTKGLAQTLSSYGIIVNGIAPGSTATRLLDYKDGETIATDDNVYGRMIMPDEVATYAKMFVSDLGNMVSGSVLYISGGRGTFDIR